ncbi:uncharacterized protein TNCV_3314691 [Trichonephila clavipes]|nr:uncharacterized protein TNCV_3314691 [Trichonephila clavipes]
MADRGVFMFGSRSLQLDKRRQASRRSFEAWIVASRKVFSVESEWKSESSYWLLKSEDNGSGKMAAHVGGVNGVVTDVQNPQDTKTTFPFSSDPLPVDPSHEIADSLARAGAGEFTTPAAPFTYLELF